MSDQKDSIAKWRVSATPDADTIYQNASLDTPKMSRQGIPYVTITTPSGLNFGTFVSPTPAAPAANTIKYLAVASANMVYNSDLNEWDVQTYIGKAGWTNANGALILAATGALGYAVVNDQALYANNAVRPNESVVITGGDPSAGFDPTDGNGSHTFQGVASLGYGFDGALFNVVGLGSAINMAQFNSYLAAMQTSPGEWAVNHTPAAATQATITRAAQGAGIQQVCRSITATLIGLAAAAEATILVNLRDGATGAGTILWSTRLLVQGGAGSETGVSITGLNIVGSDNTALTLEFAAAGGANTFESVAMTGFDAA